MKGGCQTRPERCTCSHAPARFWLSQARSPAPKSHEKSARAGLHVARRHHSSTRAADASQSLHS